MIIPLHIQRKYIDLLYSYIDKFTRHSNDRWNGRCPFCGDSKKDKLKKRFWIYKKENRFLWACYNCSTGGGMSGLLNKINPSLAKQMFIDALKENGTYQEPKFIKNEVIPNKIDHFLILQNNSLKCSNLSKTHPVINYLVSRKLDEHIDKFYFAENYGDVARKIQLKNSTRLKNDARIIIPAFDGEKQFLGCYARALDPNNTMRYISAPIEGKELIYGLDRLNYDQNIYVVEGAIDSLAIDNCVAVGCADLSRIERYIPDAKKRCILIPDGERRNKQVLQQIEKFIVDGWQVVLMPEYLIENGYKDLNNYRAKCGMSKNDIINIINKNVTSGLTAQLKFSKYKRI